MNYLRQIIAEYEPSKARAALYYVSRYVKQAEYFDKYKKDIFDDVEESAPTEETWKLSVRMIEAIEEEEDAKVADLPDQRASELLDGLIALEDELVPELSEIDAGNADNFIERMEKPFPKSSH